MTSQLRITTVVCSLIALAACEERQQVYQQPMQQAQPPQVVYQQTPSQPSQPSQPVIVQQEAGMSAGTAAVLGAGAGYLLGSANRQPQYQQPAYVPPQRTTIIQQKNITVINKTVNTPSSVQQAPAVKPAPVFVPKPVSTPSFKPTQNYAVKSQTFSYSASKTSSKK